MNRKIRNNFTKTNIDFNDKFKKDGESRAKLLSKGNEDLSDDARKAVGNLEEPKLHLRFWQKNGFKTRVGAYGSIICGIMSVIPYPPIQAIGQGGIYLAGSLLLGGIGHKAIKKKTGVKEEDQYKWIIDLIKLIINFLKKR